MARSKPTTLQEVGSLPFDSIPQGEFYIAGKAYYIRTAVYSAIFRLIGFEGHCFLVDNVVYVGTDGRYAQFVNTGDHPEAELEVLNPKIRMTISIGAQVDCVEWLHPIPTQTR